MIEAGTPGGGPPEAELVLRAADGDREAYAALVRRHSPRVYSLCASMLRRREDAQDAAQEAFVKAWRSIRHFRGGSSFATWIYRIAANACRDSLRRRSRAQAEAIDTRRPGEQGRSLEPAAKTTDESTRIEDADAAAKILGRLSPDHRLILILREAQGFNYGEIAQILDCSVDAVKGRLKRARRQLNEKLRHFSAREGV